MGLDMYAYKTKAKPETEVDFSTKNFDEVEIHYWRKHPNLHGWMESLYNEKGGKSDSFNCVPVILSSEDLDILEEDIKDGTLPNTSGFFYGNSDGSEIEDDLNFVADAKQAIAEGYTIYYTSWW